MYNFAKVNTIFFFLMFEILLIYIHFTSPIFSIGFDRPCDDHGFAFICLFDLLSTIYLLVYKNLNTRF